MTVFWRDGFWRAGRYGDLHWVRGHQVERNDWDRGGTPGIEGYRARLREARADRSSAARYVNPNAECPVCGANVFFFQNEHGSRVYFDDLGPPWPKHPCTDKTSRRRRAAAAPIFPRPRGGQEIAGIRLWTTYAQTYPDEVFSTRYGHAPWVVTEVVKRVRGADATFLVLHDLGKGAKKRFVRVARLPRWLKEGYVVALGKGRMSFVDMESLEPIEIAAKRIRSASAFVDALVPRSGDTK
jgi:hypothetical protein